MTQQRTKIDRNMKRDWPEIGVVRRGPMFDSPDEQFNYRKGISLGGERQELLNPVDLVTGRW